VRAVIVYESMYGNTHQVADAIGAGLSTAFDVSVIPVSKASPAVPTDADLVVVGGPTHAHGMSRAATRRGCRDREEAGRRPEGRARRARSRVARLVRLARPLLGQGGCLRYQDSRACRADRPGIPGSDPLAPRARLRRGRRAGELPGDEAGPARAGGDHQGARVGNQAGRGHRAELSVSAGPAAWWCRDRSACRMTASASPACRSIRGCKVSQGAVLPTGPAR
jgi:hypothetical protein